MWDKFNAQVRIMETFMRFGTCITWVHNVSGHGSPSLIVKSKDDKLAMAEYTQKLWMRRILRGRKA